eukprot:TRINITY_DN23920_c2_g2_i1.p1 TRINITY_DN23920_c2_g2~~TRINITY_DN23920_c2_g2_i1.p1  ORF type:complete len:766 (+),score=97.65 TRINITY_DN23920_c2_g2_i1:150-2447(+)
MEVHLDELLQKIGIPFDKIKGSTKRADVLESLAKRAGIEADVIQVAVWETEWDERMAAAAQPPPAAAPPQPPPAPKQQPPAPINHPAPVSSSEGPAGPQPLPGGSSPGPVGAPPKHSPHTPSSGGYCGSMGSIPPLHSPASSPCGPAQASSARQLSVEFVDPVKHNTIAFYPASGGEGIYYTVNRAPRQPFRSMVLSVHSRGPRLDFPSLKTAVTLPWPQHQQLLITLRAMAESSGVDHNIPPSGQVRRSVDGQRRGHHADLAPPSVPAGARIVPVAPPQQAAATLPSPHSPQPQLPSSQSSSRRGSMSLAPPPTATPHPQHGGGGGEPAPHVDDDETENTTSASTSWRHDPYCDSASGTDDSACHGAADGDGQAARRLGQVGTGGTLDQFGNMPVLPPVRPDRARVIVPEGGVLQLPPGTVERIVNAKYGEGDRWLSATRAVKQVTHDGGVGPLFVGTASIGLADPSPGVPKMLIVIYKPQPSAPPAEEAPQQPVPPQQQAGPQWPVVQPTQPVGPTPEASPSPQHHQGHPWASSAGQNLGVRQCPGQPHAPPGDRGLGCRPWQEHGDVISCTSSVDGPPTLDESLDTGTGHDAHCHSSGPIPRMEHLPPFVVLVSFKYGRTGEFAYDSAPAHGVHVIVEGDRGQDLGMVADSRPAGPADAARAEPRPHVLRLATRQEADFWSTGLAEQERSAKLKCQEVLEKHGAKNMRILHAEFQFDMKKLTFHYTCPEERPNFRGALNECYVAWKCRIWFQRHSRGRGDTR